MSRSLPAAGFLKTQQAGNDWQKNSRQQVSYLYLASKDQIQAQTENQYGTNAGYPGYHDIRKKWPHQPCQQGNTPLIDGHGKNGKCSV